MSDENEQARLGRYTLIRRIGKGGMGEVYLGKVSGAHGFEKAVAIKRILPQFSANPHVVNMLVDEARISVLLNHPNVVQVLELGEDEGDYFIVMEYVDGHALSRLMRKLKNANKRFDALEACFIAISVLEGLHAAHVQKDHRGKPAGIIHRDVSPQNVLVSMDGVIKVIDFGIARARERLEVTQGASVKGKLRYMAPEQLSSKLIKGKPLDARADVFAAGVLLWEMLAMRQRFNADSERDIMEQILKEDAPDLCREGLIDRELMDIVDTALEKNRDDRFPDAAAFAAKLRGYLYRRDPSFTPERVARRMREAFGEEHPSADDERRAPSGERPLHGDGDDAERTRTAFRPEDVQRRTRSTAARGDVAASANQLVDDIEREDARRPARRRRSRAAAVFFGLALGGGVLAAAFFLVVKPRVLDAHAADAGPVAQHVEVTIEVEPATARISVAGRPSQTFASPARIAGNAGEALEVVAEAEGYEPQRKSVMLGAAAAPIRLVLAALPVELEVRVVPKDAAVTVDGAPWLPGMKVAPDRALDVHAEHPFAKAKSVTVTPRAGEKLVVNLVLEELGAGGGPAKSARGVLMLTTDPSGAELFIDGRKVAGTTPAELPLSPGQHRVTLKLGPNEKTFPVDVAPGVRLRKDVSLK